MTQTKPPIPDNVIKSGYSLTINGDKGVDMRRLAELAVTLANERGSAVSVIDTSFRGPYTTAVSPNTDVEAAKEALLGWQRRIDTSMFI